MKPRVLEITPNPLEIGGVQSFFINVFPKLENYDVTALFLGGRVDSALESLLVEQGVHVKYESIGYRDPERLPRAVKAIEDELTFSRYDLAHVHGGWVRGIATYCAAVNKIGVKAVVAHSHSSIPPQPRVKGMSYPYYYLKIRNNADAIMACSEEAGCCTFGCREWRRRGIFIPNGIDLTRFSHANAVRGSIRGNDRESYIIGQVGRLVASKNYLFSIEVFAELKKRVPTARFWVLGDGEMRGELEAKVSSLGLRDCVTFFGGITDPAPYYQDMDAFIMPSKFEGLGIALIEAQASGLPCLVSDQIPKEAVLDGFDVKVLPLSKSPAAWAEILVELQQCERNREGAAAALRNYSVDTTVQRIDEVYQSLLGGNSI